MNPKSQITRRHELRCPQCEEARRITALRADMDRVTVRCSFCKHTWPSAGRGAWRLWEWKKDKMRKR